MDEKFEKLGQLIDSIESLSYGLNLNMDPQFHVDRLKNILPKKVKQLKKCFIDLSGENPWE